MGLGSLLKEMTPRDALDPHLVATMSPIVCIDGGLKILEEKSLTPEEIRSLIYSVISVEKIAQFEKNHELDFSCGDLGREQKDMYSLILIRTEFTMGTKPGL